MSHEFPDELLSAYLDGELSPEERAGVERHLTSCEADRELLEELRALRRDMAALPRAKVKPDFAERVVKSVVAGRPQSGSLARPVALRTRNWMAVVAVVAGTAACALIFVRLWWVPSSAGGSNLAESRHPALSQAQQLIASLRAAVPNEGEAVVLRLRLPMQLSASEVLDAALSSAGIKPRAATDISTGAQALGAQYQQQQQQFAQHLLPQVEGANVSASTMATVAAADALFVEAPLAQLESAFASLASDQSRTVELATEMRLAFVPRQRGEGEGGSATAAQPVAIAGPFVQRLQAEMFRLQRRDTYPAPADYPNSGSRDPNRPVRLLILVEQFDVPH